MDKMAISQIRQSLIEALHLLDMLDKGYEQDVNKPEQVLDLQAKRETERLLELERLSCP